MDCIAAALLAMTIETIADASPFRLTVDLRYSKDISKEAVMPKAIVGRWGKNLAIRFPAEIADAARLAEGERVEIEATGDEVVIRKLPADAGVEAMFAGQSAEAWRALYRDAFDWGPDLGRERVEE